MMLYEINPYVRFARRQEFRFPPEETIAYDHRIFIVEKGSALFYVGDNEYRLYAGDVIYWPSGVRYRAVLDPDTVVSGCNFDFLRREHTLLLPLSPSKKDQFTGKLVETPHFTDAPAFRDVCCFRNTYGVLPKLHELYEEYESKQLYFEQRCGALLKDVLMLCLRFYNRNRTAGATRITREVLDYIREHYHEELSAEQFGELFHYHPNHISQLIKEQTGLPLHRYIRTYRVYAALDLLQSTRLSIAQIAEQVGIGDVHQFSKVFRQIIGTSPSSFRK